MKSVYKYAAEAGLPIGIYLSSMSACILFSLQFPFLPTIFTFLLAGFPFILLYFMRRMKRIEPSYSKFAPLWLFGIYSVIFGVLICSLLSGLYLTVVDPGFISRYVAETLAAIESSPLAPQYADTTDLMHKAIEEKMLPGSMEFVASMGWFTCFGGSMLSLILAYILRSRPASQFKF